MSRRVLGRRGGQRLMTDLAHVGELLLDVGHERRFGVPALRDWLREQSTDALAKSRVAERNRRLDSDAAGVQIMTVWASKGLQFPVVYLPFHFNRYVGAADVVTYHDELGRRCTFIGGVAARGFGAAAGAGPAWEIAERRRRGSVWLFV